MVLYRMTLREFILASLVLLLFFAVQLLGTRARTLLNQVPWLDEVHTGILVDEPDPAKFHAAVSNECVDANFPVYYQALRLLHIRSLSAIRAVSLLGTMAALLGIYVLLRPSFRWCEAMVGVLTVWSTPLIVEHTFEARFYAPWFASVIWFAAAMQWSGTTRRKSLAAIAIGITSLAACTLHELGLPAVVLIVVAEMLVDRRPMKQRLLRVLPAITGAIAVFCFMPLVAEQKHSFAIKTWLIGNPVRLLYSTYSGIFPGVAASILLLGVFAAAWKRRREEHRPRDISLSPLAGASSLIFFPLVLFIVTVVFHPVLLPRYALFSTAALAAAAAYAASRMRTCIIIGVCIALVCESSAELSRRVREAGDNARDLNSMITSIRDANEPALFESRHQLFPVVWTARDLVDHCAYVDFEPGPNQLDPVVEGFERDLAKKFQRVFGWPKVMPWQQVVSLPRFLLVPITDDGDRVARRFAGYRVERISPRHYELTRRDKLDDESVFFELK
jgi:hypothetical protein